MSSIELGKVCNVLNGFAFKSNKYVSNGIRVIRIANVQKGEIVDNDPQFYPISTQKEIEKYLLEEGDLLISLTGNVGRVGILQKSLLPAALNQRVACLRITNKNIVDKRYLFNILNSNYFEHQCVSNSQGIAQKNMSTEWLKTYSLSLPSLYRQREIAAMLDKASELIKKRMEQLRELDTLAESVFYDMFGDPVTNPKGWEKKVWHELFYTRLGKMLDKNKQVTTDRLLPYLGNSNVLWGEFVLDNLSLMTFSEKEINILKLHRGDLLICEGGESGRCAVWDKDESCILFQKAIHRARIKDIGQINVIYTQRLFFELKSKGVLNKYLSKATIEHLTGEKLNKVVIPVPPIELQDQFAAIIEKIEEQKTKVKEAQKESKNLFQRLMQDMFNP